MTVARTIKLQLQLDRSLIYDCRIVIYDPKLHAITIYDRNLRS